MWCVAILNILSLLLGALTWNWSGTSQHRKYQTLQRNVYLVDVISPNEINVLSSTDSWSVGNTEQLQRRGDSSSQVRELVLSAWGLHLATCFWVYRFPACFWLLCLLWLANCQRIKKNTSNEAVFMYFIFWIHEKWCLWRHLPADPCREVILCQKPTQIENVAETFEGLKVMFFKSPQRLW